MNATDRRLLNEWIVRYADGERSVFDSLFKALWPMMLTVTSRLLTNTDAEDAAQQALLNVFRRISEFDRTRDGVSWVLAIAAYEAMTIRRRRGRRRETTDPATQPEPASDAPQPDALVAEAEIHAALVAVVGTLSPNDRAALAYVFDGTDPPTDDSSRKRRLRAVDRLKLAWRKLYG